jgi:hypothetical protein
MKKLLFFLLLPFTAFAQSSSLSSPMGNIVSISPGTIITQTSPATVFYTETIPAGVFIPNRWYHLKMAFKLTTPVIGIPGLSVTFQYGSSTFNLMTNAALVGGVTNGLFTVDFYMISTGISTQTPFATISQPNGSLLTLNTTSITPVGAFAANSAIANTFTVTLQFTGTSLGTSNLNNFWAFRDAF